MTGPRYREEVFNVVLAQILSERGVASLPEQVFKDYKSPKKWLPDLWIDYEGLTVAIEGKIGNAEAAMAQARERVNAGRAHMGVAVVYPASLQNAPSMAALRALIKDAILGINIITEAGESGLTEGDSAVLADLLRRTREELVKEDIVTEAVSYIRRVTDDFARHLTGRRGDFGRVSKALEIHALKTKKAKEQTLVVKATAGIAALTAFNAVLFQEVLSSHDTRVLSPLRFKDNRDIQQEFVNYWKYIITDIDYYPIFHAAREVLIEMGASGNLERILKEYMDTARTITQRRAALRHDLMGRVYHLLLEDAKYLGAYYTSVPAATMLLKLALKPEGWNLDWADLGRIADFGFGDFACGTGTLLMAAAEAVTDNYVRFAALKEEKPDLAELHRIMLENSIKGFDVLMSALHLTASSLVTRSPETTVTKMGIYTLPLGGREKALGSLDFLASSSLTTPSDLFSAPDTPKLVGPNGIEEAIVHLPSLDLCVMNPPFTRSVGGNLLFGSFPDDERAELQKKLRSILSKSQYSDYADLTVGLSSPFIVIGHKALKAGGRMGLVLPRTLLSGVAWDKTRALFNSDYRLEYVVVSHDPGRWNFSENTDLSEVLVVLKKTGPTKADEGVTTYVNLWRNPSKTFDALSVARVIDPDKTPSLAGPKSQGAFEIKLGDRKYGEVLTFPWARLKKRPHWLLPAAFAQSELTRLAYGMTEGYLAVPGKKTVKIVLRPLSDFGDLGYDQRDIHDGFMVSDHFTPYKAFWSHDSEAVTTMAQTHNAYLSPLGVAKPRRHLKNASELWRKAGHILLAERMRLNTHKLNSILLDSPVLPNVWWPFLPKFKAKRLEKSVVLWLNSTLGILQLLCNREETQGAWVKFKKPRLLSLPVLDLKSLTAEQAAYLAKGFDRLASEPLKSLPEMTEDPTRIVIDSLLSKALGLPDLAVVREMLAREPIICLERL